MKTCERHPYAPLGPAGCFMCRPPESGRPKHNDRVTLNIHWERFSPARARRRLMAETETKLEPVDGREEPEDVSLLVDPSFYG